MKSLLFLVFSGLLISLPHASAETFLLNPIADAFVATGSPGNPLGADLTANNYGGAGTLALSGSGSVKGEFQSFLKFDLSAAATQFNSVYGAGNWSISSVTLQLASNFAVQGAQPNNNIFNAINGGNFAIDWMSSDSWTEGTGNPSSPGGTGINYDSLATLLGSSDKTLGSYNYVPPGNNVPVTWTLGLDSAFVADAAAGNNVSLRLYALDSSMNYLFNSQSFASNHPLLTVTAVPEPATCAMLGLGLLCLLGFRRLKAQGR